MKGREISLKEEWSTSMPSQSSIKLCVALLLAGSLIVGCSTETIRQKEIKLATTTSTQDSGLLDVLLPAFERETSIKVNVVAVGSGQALELGRRGDADVLLTHSPAAEAKFVAEGWCAKRVAVMHNDFVVVGPAEDLAGISSASTAAIAFRLIADRNCEFVSRGDESGTHQKELSVWKQAEIEPAGDWYVQAGSGMAQTLRMAHEKTAYALCDRATYLSLKDEVELVVLVEGDAQLLNRYSVLTLNSTKHPHIHREEANRFADFLTSPNGQKIISTFGIEKFNQPLFFGDAKAEPIGH